MYLFQKTQGYSYVYGIGLLCLVISCTCNNDADSNRNPSVPDKEKPSQPPRPFFWEKWIQKAKNNGYNTLADTLAKLEKGETVDINYEVLAEAVMLDHADIFNKLIASGAKLDIKDENNSTLLHQAAQGGSIEIVKILIEKLPLESYSQEDQKGFTPLHYAILNNQVEIAKILIDKLPVDILSKKDKYENTLLHYAVKNYPVIEAIAIPMINKLPADKLNEKDVSGFAPLHYCAMIHTNTEIASKLIAKGADINILTKSGYTPLFLAKGRKKLEMEKLLLKAGANNDYKR